MARQFLQDQLAAGRTAAQIAAAHNRIAGPWRAASAGHSPAQAARFRAYTELIAATLEELRAAERSASTPSPGLTARAG